jgi:hypothetical protein
MTITSLMLEKDVQPMPAQPSEREIMQQFRAMVRVARVVLVAMALLVALRFVVLAMGFEQTEQPYRMFVILTHPLAAPVLDLWPDVTQIGPREIEVQGLVAATCYLILARLLTHFARRRRRPA